MKSKPFSKTRTKLLGILFLAMTGSTAWAQSFTVSTTQQAVTIHPGDQNVAVNVNVSRNGFEDPINVTLSGLPSGISVSPLTLRTNDSGTIALNAALNADQEAFPATEPYNPNTAANTVTVVAAAGSLQATCTFTLIVSLTNPAFTPDLSNINLPILTIDTNGVPLINKGTLVPGTVTITSADGQTSYLPNSSDTDNTATFHVRGNSTSEMPKKPYEIKLNTSLDLLTTMGLSCPYVTSSGKPTCDKSKTYVLLANYDDKTLLRDWAASALANAIPMGAPYLSSPAGSPTPSGTSTLMPWAAHSLFVEVYLNGVYEGNYQLIEKVNVDSHRLNITELTASDTADVTGGYLLEIDHHLGEATFFYTPEGLPIGLVDPDFAPTVPQQTTYITNYVDAAETALFSSNFTDPVLGWRAYFDEASAVNFYIVNDLMGNVDGGDFGSSDYLYKQLDSPLLYMGPIWDFDISSGNTNSSGIVDPFTVWMQARAIWYVQWFKDPGFKADVITQWNALEQNGVFTAWLASINQESASLEQSQANNFGRWPMLGIMVWPDAEAAGSYDGEMAYFTTWLQSRIGYLDAQFNNKQKTSTVLGVSSGTVRAGSPVTLTAQVTGGTAPTGSVSFLSNKIVVGTATLDGGGDASLTTTALPVGAETLTAIYSGDDTNSISGSHADAVTVLAPLDATVTSLASSTESINSGSNATFTVSVIANSGTAIPTSTLAFSSNGTPLGMATLTGNGTVTFATASLAAGLNSVQAVYGGDANYAASTSNSVRMIVYGLATPVFSPAGGTYTSAQTVTIMDTAPNTTFYYTTDGSTPTISSTLYAGPITVNSSETIETIGVATGFAPSAVAIANYTIDLLPATFTVSASPSSLNVQSGQSGSVALTITPQNNFTTEITFGCSGLPGGAACTFMPSSVTPGNSTATTTCTISTGGNSAGIAFRSLGLLGVMVAMPLIFWPVRKRRTRIAYGLFCLFAAGFAMGGCGGGSPHTTAYSVAITATGGSVSQVATVQVIVKN